MGLQQIYLKMKLTNRSKRINHWRHVWRQKMIIIFCLFQLNDALCPCLVLEVSQIYKNLGKMCLFIYWETSFSDIWLVNKLKLVSLGLQNYDSFNILSLQTLNSSFDLIIDQTQLSVIYFKVKQGWPLLGRAHFTKV